VFAENAERAMQADATAYVTIGGALLPALAGETPPEHSVISVLLQGSREACLVAPAHRQSYHSLMTDEDRQWIEREGVHVLVPIFSARAGNTLFGMVALKRRRNALAYSQDDLRFLQTAAASANLACDAIAYDGQRDRSEAEELARQCTRCGRVD